MRKRIVPVGQAPSLRRDGGWLDLGAVAEVEVTSEDPEHPIESALIPGQDGGWRANAPGRQVVRLLFSPAQKVTHIQLRFEEKSVARTQEYVLQWASECGQPYREIVRQQWNFSPSGAILEIEGHEVDLPSVEVLELIIDPGSESQVAYASLESMRIG
ncbi:MAG: carbohydrate-binding protein [Sedimenticolaceae bacterium]